MDLEAGVSHSALLKTGFFLFPLHFMYLLRMCAVACTTVQVQGEKTTCKRLGPCLLPCGFRGWNSGCRITANAFTCWIRSLAQRKEFSLSPNSGSVSSQFPEQPTWHWFFSHTKYNKHTHLLGSHLLFCWSVTGSLTSHTNTHACTHAYTNTTCNF